MIDFIFKKEDFLNCKNKFHKHFKVEIFEKNPFKDNFKHFYAFEFDFLYNVHFFKGLQTFIKKSYIDYSTFYTVSPHPKNYFHKHFGKYNTFNIYRDTIYDSFHDILNRDPKDSPADALSVNTTEVAWFSDSKNWAILASRNWEIAVIGFSDYETKNEFLSSFDNKSKTMFNTIEEEVNQLDEMLQFSNLSKLAYKSLITNYQDKS